MDYFRETVKEVIKTYTKMGKELKKIDFLSLDCKDGWKCD